MTKQAMSEKLSNFIEQYGNAFMVGLHGKNELIYTNEAATTLFGISTENPSIDSLFTHADQTLKAKVKEGLEKVELIVLNDLPVENKQGEIIICDVQMGFFDTDKTEIFLEIIPKPHKQIEEMKQEIDKSPRPVAILNHDETLSIFHSNHLFGQVVQKPETASSDSNFVYNLASALVPEKKEDILNSIKEDLLKKDTTKINIELSNSYGELQWHSLELRKRAFGQHGNKVLALLTNVENIVKTEEKLQDINQYFNILQSMCKGLLYRFDIHTRTLYRNEETAKIYNVPTVAKNFPTPEWLENVLHPEDIAEFVAFVDKIVKGQGGSHTARFLTPSGRKEYHKFTFKPIYLEDGSVKEMIGCATNIQDLKETQEELENVNQYFHILQSMSSGMLYRFDIKNRILHRNKANAHSFILPEKGENYPDVENLKNVIHPDDLNEYVEFIDTVIQGKEGALDSRVKTQSGEYQYHRMTFKPLLHEDGSIKEMIGKSKNIHYIKKTEQELENINQYFCAIQELSDDLLYRIDIKNKTLIRREKVDGKANLFGTNIVATDFPESVCENGFIHPEDEKTYIKFGHKALDGVASMAEVRMKSKQGHFSFRRIICVPVFNIDGSVTEMLGKVVNIDGVRQLEQQAQYDDLTNLLNKRAMLEMTASNLAKAHQKEIHALFFLDLDDFKYVNDNLGHAFGDYLLKELGKRLKENTRQGDLVGRVGGDEFVVFLKDVPSVDMLMGKAKMLLAAISEDIIDGEKRHAIHGSIGIAVYPEHGTNYEELYHHADISLYQSKHHGKNVATLYKPEE